MNASTWLSNPTAAAAWAQVAVRGEPIFPNEPDAAAKIVSAERIDFREALDRVRAKAYAQEQCASEPITNYADRRGV